MAIKEELKAAVKVSRKTFFNPTAWFGYDMFLAQTESIVRLIKNFFISKEVTHPETFSDAMIRLGISEADLPSIRIRYLCFAIFLALIGIFFTGYGLYLLGYKSTFAGFLLSISAAGVGFVHAMRFHFFYFQISHRKLGCHYHEWLAGKVDEDKGEQP